MEFVVTTGAISYTGLPAIECNPGSPPMLVGAYWSKGRWRWRWQLDYWRYDTQSSCQIITNNKPTPAFYRSDALLDTWPTIWKHRKEDLSHFIELLTPRGVLQPSMWLDIKTSTSVPLGLVLTVSVAGYSPAYLKLSFSEPPLLCPVIYSLTEPKFVHLR